jgi:hypothetical protein
MKLDWGRRMKAASAAGDGERILDGCGTRSKEMLTGSWLPFKKAD